MSRSPRRLRSRAVPIASPIPSGRRDPDVPDPGRRVCRRQRPTPSAPPAAAVPAPTVVHTSGGAVRGVDAPGYRVFDGIPYAAPPVGALRWQPPAPVVPWQGVRDATRPGLRCPQDTRNDPDYGRPTGEDCLNLNVWTPDGATPATPRRCWSGSTAGAFSTAVPTSMTRVGWRPRATSSSSRSTTGSGHWGSWRIRR